MHGIGIVCQISENRELAQIQPSALARFIYTHTHTQHPCLPFSEPPSKSHIQLNTDTR